MRIKVYLPPYLGRKNIDANGYVHLHEGSKLKDLFHHLEVPFPAAAVHLCRVNYEKAGLDTELKDGDTVSFFSLISGG